MTTTNEMIEKLEEAGEKGCTARKLGVAGSVVNPETKKAFDRMRRRDEIVRVGWSGGKNTRYALAEIIKKAEADREAKQREEAEPRRDWLLDFVKNADPRQLEYLEHRARQLS